MTTFSVCVSLPMFPPQKMTSCSVGPHNYFLPLVRFSKISNDVSIDHQGMSGGCLGQVFMSHATNTTCKHIT